MAEAPGSLDPELLLSQTAWLRRLARALTSDAEEAEDLAQETWLAALRHPPAYAADAGRLRRWLAKVARHLAWRGRMAGQARAAREQAVARTEHTSPEEGYEDRIVLQKRLAEALLGLDEPYRSAVAMRYFDGLSAREIAERQGTSEEGARQRVSRGLAVLRARLDRENSGGRDGWRALCVALWEQPPQVTAAGALTGGVVMGIKFAWAVAFVALASLVAWRLWPEGGSEPLSDAGRRASSPTALAAGTTEQEKESVEVLGRREAQSAPAPGGSPASERVIDRERDLHGVVLDPDGKPLPGAEIVAVRTPAGGGTFMVVRGLASFDEPEASTTSDERGEFAVLLPQGVPVDVEVRHPSYGSSLLGFRYAGERIEVRMQLSASLYGRVVRKVDGAPLPHTLVRVSPKYGSESLSTRPQGRLIETETDQEGRFAFERLPAIPISLRLTPSFEAATASVSIDLQPGASIEREIELEPGETIHGRVVDAISGEPIAGAEVCESWTFDRIVRTDASGEYQLPGFPANMVSVSARAAGYGKLGVECRDTGSRYLHTQVDFALSRARSARGRIVDPSGSPLEGVYVAIVGSEWFGTSGTGAQQTEWTSTRSGSVGTFAIDGLRRDIDLALLLATPGYGNAVHEFSLWHPTEIPDTHVFGDVVMNPGVLVLGDFVDEKGVPIADWPIQLTGWNADRSRYCPMPADGPPYVPGSSDRWFTQSDGTIINTRPRMPSRIEGLDHYVGRRTARTDDLGRFSFADLAPGTYRVEAKEPGRPSMDWPYAEVIVSADGTPERVKVVRGGGLAIAGRVVGPDGKPVQGAWITVNPEPAGRGESGTGVYVRSDASGRFRIGALEARAYRLQADNMFSVVETPDAPVLAASMLADVQAGREDLEVRLPAGDYIVGRVVDAGGVPRSGERVIALNDKGWQVGGGVTDAEGRVRVLVGSNETYDLIVRWSQADLSTTAGIAAYAKKTEKLRIPLVAPGPAEIEIRLP